MAEKHHNQDFVDQALDWLPTATLDQALDFYETFVKDDLCTDWTIAEIGKGDRYFLLTHLLNRYDAIHPWLYERCREVESEPDGCLDLWAREHYKSTIITFAGSIQEILKDPEITIGIFSHTRPIAKAFQRQIKREFETNIKLKMLYPEIVYENPRKDSPQWSEENGIIVKRKSNPKESTIEAWGLVDGAPTSKHFRLMIYDDVVTRESINTPDMIHKTTDAWELSRHLSAQGEGSQGRRTWTIGTRYNYADTYQTMLDRKVFHARIYPATDDGSPEGKPIFLKEKDWEEKKKESSPYTIACQMLQNPLAGKLQEMQPEWLRRFEIRPKTLNVYILGDYAGSKAQGSSNTAFIVLGIDQQQNKYWLDGAIHRMDLSERWKMLKALHQKWARQQGIQLVRVGYERYGAQSDVQHFETMMRFDKYHFPIDEVNWPRQGPVDKDNRIRRLIPDMRNWRFFIPYEGEETTLQRETKDRGEEYLLSQPIKQINHDGRVYNVLDYWIQNEYLFFPNTTKKDGLDAMSRVYDMEPTAPSLYEPGEILPEVEG